ncbi:MAG: hypothetical protein JNN08_15280 [Bryobacterales bacterium]|nr:hypothetical protein [Bryobacterales bacterium]
MASIKLIDGLNLDFTPNPVSSFEKYLVTPGIEFVPAAAFAASWTKKLSEVGTEAVTAGLSFKQKVELGSGVPELTVTAGVRARTAVFAKAGKDIFAGEFLGDEVKTPAGKAYVSFGFEARLGAGVSESVNDLTFGVDANGTLQADCYALCDQSDTLAKAVQGVLENFIIAGDLNDLKAMPVGSIFSAAGKGSFKVSGGLSVDFGPNPMALPTPPGVLPAKLKAGGSAGISASVKVSGEYQIRARKTAEGVVRLGYHKRRASEVNVEVSASAGVDLTVGKTSLIEKLMQSIVPDEDFQETMDQLSGDGLSNDARKAIDDALAASIDRSLSVSLTAAFNRLKSGDAAFLWDIELDRLKADGRDAVNAALDGNLVPLTSMEEHLPEGITLRKSVFQEVRRKKTTIKVNLLGILNYISVSELIVKGRVLFEPLTGTLVVTDAATANTISAVTKPLEADGEKLRQLMAQCVLVTASYRAANASGPLTLSSGQTFFEFHRKTKRDQMKDYLDAVQGMGLITKEEKTTMLDRPDYGPSTILLEADYDDALCARLFLDAKGKPRKMDEYESAGRLAIRALTEDDDDQSYRSIPMTNDTLWKKMRAAGQPGIGATLPPALRNDVSKLGAIIADYSVIVWWAKTMQETGKEVEKMRAFLKANPNVDLRHDNSFKRLRNELADHLGKVAKDTKTQFGEPWGLLAMANVVKGEATVSALINAREFTLDVKTERALGSAA